VLLATENAPPHKKAWYGMFPQLGAPIGLFISIGIFLVLVTTLTKEQFLTFGWRIPFIASALLVWVGLYVRLKLTETPDFLKIIDKNERVKLPMADVFVKHTKALLLGTFATITTFLLFYLLTVFTVSWGTTALHYTYMRFLVAELISVPFFALGVPLSAFLADRYGRSKVLMPATILIFLYGLVFAPLFSTGSWGTTVFCLVLGMFLMGLTYGPIGTALAGIFPASVRYTGASLSFTLAGILGASLTPLVATTLAKNYGLPYVGYYLSFAAAISFLAFVAARKAMKENAEGG